MSPEIRSHPVSDAVSIAAGDLAADIIGGPLLTVTSLRLRDVEMLVDAAELPREYRVHAERAGITLLHPWANRLGGDDFQFGGVEAHLDRTDAGVEATVTRDGNGLAIHGLTGGCRWRPEPVGPSACRAALTWLGTPAFPFPHQVLVQLEIIQDESGAALRFSTTVAALSAVAVPVSFGWHPYFRCDRRAGTELELPGLSALQADARGLPTGACIRRGPARISLVDQHFDEGVLLHGPQMSMHQSSADGSAQSITVDFDQGYPYGQLFAPVDAPVVSLEPMTAPTDALRQRAGLPVAVSDRPYTAQFTVGVLRSEPALRAA